MPTVPVSAAGWRIEPPVSVPVAAIAIRAAIAAEDPPDEPPGTSFRAALAGSVPDQGLIAGPKALVILPEPIANSSRFVLPSITQPASNNFCETVDS